MKNMKLLLTFALLGCAYGSGDYGSYGDYGDYDVTDAPTTAPTMPFDPVYWANSASSYTLNQDADIEALYNRIAASDGQDGISVKDAKDFVEYLLSVEAFTDLAEESVSNVLGYTYHIDWDIATQAAHSYIDYVLYPYYGTEEFPPPDNSEFTWDLAAFSKFIKYYVGVWIEYEDDTVDFQTLHFAGATDDAPPKEGEPKWLGALVTAVGGKKSGGHIKTYDHKYWADTKSSYTLKEPADVEALYHRIADADDKAGLSLTDVKHFVTYLLSVDDIVELANTAVQNALDMPDFKIDVETALPLAYDFIHDVLWPYYTLGYVPLDDTPFEDNTFDLEEFSKFIGFYVGLWIEHGEALGVEFQELHFQAETDDGPPRKGEPEWLGALLTGINGGYGGDDCDSSCSCNFVGTGTNLNVQFLCQADNVCYNLVSGWCAEDETACEIPN